MDKLSLFSGIGGDDIASDWVGIKTVCFVEKEPFCQSILHKHWINTPIIGDVKDVTKESLYEASRCEKVDIISGGFPCQDVSIAGLRQGITNETRSGLWGEYARIIGIFKPRWVVVENVRGLLSIDNGGGFRGVLRDIDNLGYNAGWCVLRASQYGAKHQRERIFIIANSYSDRRITLSVQERIYKQVSQQRFCYDIDLFNYLQGFTTSCPEHLRAVDGFSYKLDSIRKRIKACGNAVVPQQIYPIYKAIVDVESMINAWG